MAHFPKEACKSCAVVALNSFLSSPSLNPSLLCPLYPSIHLSIYLGLCRLCRRMSRDYLFRGNSAARTLKMWGNVRRGEEKWIFPHQNHADYVINSAMEYEMPTLKSRCHSLTHYPLGHPSLLHFPLHVFLRLALLVGPELDACPSLSQIGRPASRSGSRKSRCLARGVPHFSQGATPPPHAGSSQRLACTLPSLFVSHKY
jgi:hypothetical protein